MTRGLAMKAIRVVCALLALTLLLAGLSYGQAVTGSLLGTITDSSGAAVPNAKVTITDANTGISRTATTNESGNFSFVDLPPGTYRVATEQTGFKRAERAGADVIVNTTIRVDLAL